MKLDYELIRSGRRTLAIEILRDGKVVIRAPHSMGMQDIEHFINEKAKWIEKHKQRAVSQPQKKPLDSYSEAEIAELKERARRVILPLAEHYASIVGVEYKSVKINRAKRRFGSCSEKNTLNFSCFLMLYPTEAVEYVVVHELCHILEHNHSRRFYSNIERVMPDYRSREKLLLGR